jgi:hypothetical protein
MTIDLIKQSAIPWSYKYKPPESVITYDVSNTCAMDTALQMIFFLWFAEDLSLILLWRRILYFFKP